MHCIRGLIESVMIIKLLLIILASIGITIITMLMMIRERDPKGWQILAFIVLVIFLVTMCASINKL